MLSVRNAQVGHIVATLRALEQRHLLVVQTDDYVGGGDNDADVDEIMTAAHSLAEIQRGIG